MSPTRRLARPLLASTFVLGGVHGLRTPGPRVESARAAGLTEPEKVVRVHAVSELVAGLSLATGRLPRLSALALAAGLVPATVVGHAFWQEKDKAQRSVQKVQFLKSLTMLGGLLLATADTGGRESLPHAAGRASRKARKAAAASGVARGVRRTRRG